MTSTGNLSAYRKTVFNPMPTALSWRWDGFFYTIFPGATLTCPLFLAEHLLKHLRAKGLREASKEDIMSATRKEFSEDQRNGVIGCDAYGLATSTTPTASTVPQGTVTTTQVNVSIPQATVTVPAEEPKVYKCNVPECDYTNEKEAGVLMHQRMKHREVTYGK